MESISASLTTVGTAQQQQQAQQLAQMQQVASAAKDVGQATAQGSGLENVMQQFQGY